MEERKLINIQDFSVFPGGRYRANGPFSGEQFREEVLVPALGAADFVTVDLRAAKVVIPSFLDEAFGPLVEQMGAEKFLRTIDVLVKPDSDMKFNFDETVRLRSKKR